MTMMMMMIIIVVVVVMVMIIIIALKGPIRDLYHLPTAPRIVSNKWPGRNSVQIKRKTSSAYHVQHVVCHMVRRDSSAAKFDRAETAFI